MTKNIHFISGLPRSGSTLLAALLQKNPKVHANMSGPVAGMINTLMESMSAKNEFSIFVKDAQRHRILRGIFDSYYGEDFPGIVFDTSRMWCARLPLLQILQPSAKVIACVRDTSWIIDSVERLTIENAATPSPLFGYTAGGTVYSRADTLAGSNGLLGFAYNALKEAFYGPYSHNLLIVQYETLSTQPQRALEAIYDFIGEPSFTHDFENVYFDVDVFDTKTGAPGLHRVRSTVSPNERRTVLPPDLFNKFINDAFWKNPAANPNGVVIV